MPSRRIIFCSGERTSMSLLDNSKTKVSLTAEDESMPNKLQTMFGPASSRSTCQHFHPYKKTHSTSENWPNCFSERSLSCWKNIIYRQQRDTTATTVWSQDKNKIFQKSSYSPCTNRNWRTPTPRRRLRRRRRRKSKTLYKTNNNTEQQKRLLSEHFFWTQQKPAPTRT